MLAFAITERGGISLIQGISEDIYGIRK